MLLPERMLQQKVPSGLHDPPAFAGVERIRRARKASGAPVADLDHDEVRAVPAYQVELPETAAVSPRDEIEPLPPQEARCAGLRIEAALRA